MNARQIEIKMAQGAKPGASRILYTLIRLYHPSSPSH